MLDINRPIRPCMGVTGRRSGADGLGGRRRWDMSHIRRADVGPCRLGNVLSPRPAARSRYTLAVSKGESSGQPPGGPCIPNKQKLSRDMRTGPRM